MDERDEVVVPCQKSGYERNCQARRMGGPISVTFLMFHWRHCWKWRPWVKVAILIVGQKRVSCKRFHSVLKDCKEVQLPVSNITLTAMPQVHVVLFNRKEGPLTPIIVADGLWSRAPVTRDVPSCSTNRKQLLGAPSKQRRLPLNIINVE